jgi:Zn ribbon nucleic-acid-binding protein
MGYEFCPECKSIDIHQEEHNNTVERFICDYCGFHFEPIYKIPTKLLEEYYKQRNNAIS